MKAHTKHKRAVGILEGLNEDVKHMSTATYVEGRRSTMSGGVIKIRDGDIKAPIGASYTDGQRNMLKLFLSWSGWRAKDALSV